MNKTDFLTSLSMQLNFLPPSELEKTQSFYAEMIADRMDEGMEEEAAVAAIGDIETIVNETLQEMSLPTLMKAKIQPKSGWKISEIVLIILGFPLWFPLLVAFFLVIVAVYVSIWAVIISLYTAVMAFIISGMVGIFSLFFASGFANFLMILGLSFICTGIGILSFFGVTKLSTWLIKLTGHFLGWVKSLFVAKGGF